MPWFLLILAGLFEIGWAIGLKYTVGFTRLWPSLATAACIVISGLLLAAAARALPIGTAYAVWTGIGTLGTLLIGMLFLGEPVSLLRCVCAALILLGVIGLKLA